MPAVFVHGNPETPAVWEPLLDELNRPDVVNLQLPGFGTPAPAGFDATKESYTAWLIEQLENIGEPVDLVGHDWGGGFALRVACTRPDLLRTWASDIAGVLHPEYIWHDYAQIWQSSEGEASFEAQLGAPLEDMVALYLALGITPNAAASFASAASAEMARCVLALYRSAAQPAMTSWGSDAPAAAARPGLVICAANDLFTGGPVLTMEMATKLGATYTQLDGLGHWWMLQDPAKGAVVLRKFWSDNS